VRIGQRRAAKRREPRLCFAIDDFEIEPERFVHPVEELVTVCGHTTGFRRDQTRAGDAALLHLRVADGKRVERAGDCRLAELARLMQALAEPDDPRKCVDDAQAVGAVARAVVMRPRDQEAAIVGAEIERRVGVARWNRSAGGRGRVAHALGKDRPCIRKVDRRHSLNPAPGAAGFVPIRLIPQCIDPAMIAKLKHCAVLTLACGGLTGNGVREFAQPTQPSERATALSQAVFSCARRPSPICGCQRWPTAQLSEISPGEDQ
jgi:hypothetical protein